MWKENIAFIFLSLLLKLTSDWSIFSLVCSQTFFIFCYFPLRIQFSIFGFAWTDLKLFIKLYYTIVCWKFFQTKQNRPIEIELKLPLYVIGEMQNTSSVFDGSLGKVFSTIIILTCKTICNALHLNENWWFWWFDPMCLLWREAATNDSTYDFE